MGSQGARHRRDDGSQGQPRGSKLDAHEAFLLGLVAEEEDITLLEMQARLCDEHGVSAGTATLWRFFEARGLTFKKNRALAAEQERPDVRRQAWFEGRLSIRSGLAISRICRSG